MKKNIVLFLSCLLIVQGTFAQRKTTNNSNVQKQISDTTRVLKQVDVVETAISNKKQLSQPSSEVKLGPLELKRATGLFLTDVINTNVPGVFMVNRTCSAGQQLNIRGYGNGMGVRGISNNFDSQGFKMYLNGIPVTDAEGITVMDDIDYSTIAKVDITKGPAGSLYGLAVSGAVNLQSQKAEPGKTSIGQDVLFGSYGLLRTTTHLAIGREKSSVLLTYGHNEFDGFMRHTSSRKDFVNMIADFELNRKQSVTSYMGFTDSYDQRNGELTIAQYDTLDYVLHPQTTGNPAYVKNDAHSGMRTFRAGFGHTYKFDDTFSNTTSLFGFTQNMDNSSAGGWTDKTSLNYGFRSVFNKVFNLSESLKLAGAAGLEMQKMNAISVGYNMGADSTNLAGYNIPTSIKSDQALTNSTANYFTNWTLDLPFEFSVNAGLGLSNMAIRLNDRMWVNKKSSTKLKVFEQDYQNLLSPSLAINKKFGESASVFVSYSTAYRAPVSSNVLISYTGQVNTDLKPEKGTQIEVGTKGNWFDNRLFYTVSFFHARFENKFTSVAVLNPAQTATLYSYLVNGGSQNDNGLEMLVKYDLIKSSTAFVSVLRPFANLSYSDFKYDVYKYQSAVTPVDYSGKKVAGVSPLVYNIGIDAYTKVGLYGNVTYNYRDAMYITSDNLNKTKSYSLLNAKVGYKTSLGRFDVEAYVGANNILSTQYYAMVFVNQLPDAYIPAPKDINYFGGVSLKYNL